MSDHPRPDRPHNVLIGLIGAGIQASSSPALHEVEGRAQGLSYQYRLIDLETLGLTAAALPELLTAARRFGCAGCNITHPCKQAVIPLLDELASDAAGAVAVADRLVNATPVGMVGHPGMPVPRDWLRPGLWVADVVYFPLETELLRTARAIGCRTMDGGMMAVFQAVGAFRLFTGIEPDADRMIRHFASM
jgi:shikimate 5-dehydrogenase